MQERFDLFETAVEPSNKQLYTPQAVPYHHNTAQHYRLLYCDNQFTVRHYPRAWRHGTLLGRVILCLFSGIASERYGISSRNDPVFRTISTNMWLHEWAPVNLTFVCSSHSDFALDNVHVDSGWVYDTGLTHVYVNFSDIFSSAGPRCGTILTRQFITYMQLHFKS